MKKRLLSILLVLTMVLSLVPAMSVTASAETIDRTSWTKITGSTTIETKGDYYLDSDMTANITVAEGVEATLDLNGHILTAGSTGSAIVNNGTLTLTDNDKSVTHYYTAGSNGLWTLNTGASSGTPYENLTERPAADTVIAIKGGAVTGGTKGTLIDGSNYGCGYTVAVGGGIYSAGDLTVDGAVICGNTIDNSQGGTCMGIGIFCAGENCTLKNAIICGNCSIPQEYNPRGGAIFSASTIKAEDSSLSFNTVSFTGGAIMLRNKQDKTGYFSTLTMKNCSLLGKKIRDLRLRIKCADGIEERSIKMQENLDRMNDNERRAEQQEITRPIRHEIGIFSPPSKDELATELFECAQAVGE